MNIDGMGSIMENRLSRIRNEERVNREYEERLQREKDNRHKEYVKIRLQELKTEYIYTLENENFSEAVKARKKFLSYRSSESKYFSPDEKIISINTEDLRLVTNFPDVHPNGHNFEPSETLTKEVFIPVKKLLCMALLFSALTISGIYMILSFTDVTTSKDQPTLIEY